MGQGIDSTKSFSLSVFPPSIPASFLCSVLPSFLLYFFALCSPAWASSCVSLPTLVSQMLVLNLGVALLALDEMNAIPTLPFQKPQINP